jgi:membrane-associated protein
MYNVLGGALWVFICVGAGYMFGNIDVVKENFELVVIGIIGVSVLPMVVEVIRQWKAGTNADKR